jgi:hypothetical protein
MALRLVAGDAFEFGGDGSLVESPFGDAHGQCVKSLGVVPDDQAVAMQEDLRGQQAGALVLTSARDVVD